MRAPGLPQDLLKALAAERVAVIADNARLRAALKDIIYRHVNGVSYKHPRHYTTADIARAALAATGGEP